MSGIQAKAVELDWKRMRDMETYYPLRDDRLAVIQCGRARQYPTRWVVEAKSLAKVLSDGEVAIATHCRTLHALTLDKSQTHFEYTDQSAAINLAEVKRLRRLDLKHELARYRGVAARIPRGDRCFAGIIESDSLSELRRRCAIPRGSDTVAIELVRTVLRALELYRGLDAPMQIGA